MDVEQEWPQVDMYRGLAPRLQLKSRYYVYS